MPLNVLGCTRITMLTPTSFCSTCVLRTCLPFLSTEWEIFSRLNVTGIDHCNLILNEEFLVGVLHQYVPITSLLFVHTARRSYQWNEKVNMKDYLFLR